MSKLALDKRDVTLNEKDSCLDMLVFVQALCGEYAKAGKLDVRKECKQAFEATRLALQEDCELWERALRREPRI